MKMGSYALAKTICLEMGIKWDNNAQYATIGQVELRKYLLKNPMFIDLIEGKYHPVEHSASVYERIKGSNYILAA